MRTALITGGASGMGRACAIRFAERGHAVAVLDRDGDEAERVAAALPRGDHVAVTADVANRDQVERAVAHVTEAIGAPAVLVNSAGILRSTRFLEITEEEWRAVIDVSLTGSFLCSQACLPPMIRAGWGRIVNFSSTAGKSVSTLGGAHYTAAKAALLGLTRAVAQEVGPHGVTVNAVCPGLVDTPMARSLASGAELARHAERLPVPRLGTPEEVAELVLFLCSERAGYITGASLDVNGGDLMI
jgi:NAD(P)-dependent dehydrogenase (short-subunit alcohol dehydrogenase family)